MLAADSDLDEILTNGVVLVNRCRIEDRVAPAHQVTAQWQRAKLRVAGKDARRSDV